MKRTGFHALPLLLGAIASTGALCGQTVDVRAQIVIAQTHLRKADAHYHSPEAVLWLKPLNPAASFRPPMPGRFRMVQKNKSFEPHLLVIPLGSTVEFPNLDPFFHNVFSQFNGKRFDLGLYETGSTRDVRFDRQGVSYIFCNIHPEMSAVIITVPSPWFAISSGGTVLLHAVLPGMYEVHVWASGADARQLNALTRRVRIGPDNDSLGTISIQTDARPATHKNKFGDDYPPDVIPTY
jgi:plastocyanin